MKRYLSLLLGILGFVPILAQQSDYYYYYKGNRINLSIDSTRLYVVSNGEFQQQSTTRTMDYSIAYSIKSNIYNIVTPLEKRRTVTPNVYFSTLLIPKDKSAAQYDSLIEKVKNDSRVWQVLPSFSIKGEKLNVTNNFYVKLKSSEDIKTLQEMANQYKIEIIGHHEHMPLWHVLSCNTSSTLNALEAANLFHESGKFICSEPEFSSVIRSHSADSYYSRQWNLKNTVENSGILGIDINIEEAWTITKGQNVTVAVYDEAIYKEHPDLIGNVADNGYHIGTGSIPIFDPTSCSDHGNGSAGVIAAVQDNDIGLSGVAPESKVMSIAYSGDLAEYSAMEVSLGFTEAVELGADIINCAWDFGLARESIIDNAIELALTQGRGGKGCVVVFAAGNYRNTDSYVNQMDVKYPAECNPRILTVGGINSYGYRLAHGFMQDHYSFVASCYGEELDVVAPAALIWSIKYPDGTIDSPRYYSDGFCGTSAACAHVSAIAALMLSIHPDLTVDQVVDIIEYTAKKERPELYSYQNYENRPNGTWNEEMGYGLVDATAAVKIAEKASRTTYIRDMEVTGAVYEYDYDVEVENVIVEDGGILEIDKDRSVILKRSILVKEGGSFIVFKQPISM